MLIYVPNHSFVILDNYICLYNSAKHYWYKIFSHDALGNPLAGPIPLQQLSTHEGAVAPRAQSICMNSKCVGSRLEVTEHTQAIPVVNKGMPLSNI